MSRLSIIDFGSNDQRFSNTDAADIVQVNNLSEIANVDLLVSGASQVLENVDFLTCMNTNARELGIVSGVKRNVNGNLVCVDDAHATSVLNLSSFGTIGYEIATASTLHSASGTEIFRINSDGIDVKEPAIFRDTVDFKAAVTFDVNPTFTDLSGLSTVSINANPSLDKYIEYKATTSTNNLFTRNNDTGTFSILKGSTIGTASSVLDISSTSIVYAGNITNTLGTLTNNQVLSTSITSTGSVSGVDLSSSDQFLAAVQASGATPSYSFTDDPNTGMYNVSADVIGFSTGGSSDRLQITSQGILLRDGTAASPSASFISDTDTGIFRKTTNTIGIACAGTEMADFNASNMNIRNAGGVINIVNTSASNQLNIVTGAAGSGSGIKFHQDEINNFSRFDLRNIANATSTSRTFQLAYNTTGCGIEIVNSASVRPPTNNVFSFGDSTKRWSEIFATNGTINTSDQNLKEFIQDETLGIDFIMSLHPVKYKWREMIVKDINDNDLVIPAGNRFHSGLIAQEVKTALDAAGEDRGCYIDPAVNNSESTDPKGLRYEQMIGILIKALQDSRNAIIDLQNRVSTLEGLL